MPFPSPSRTPSGPRRRSLLASAAGAALFVGCSSPDDDSDSGTHTGPSAAERARARAARDSAGLVERYDAVITVHPALARRLRPLRAEAVRHREAFGGVGDGSGSPTASPSPGADAEASPSVSPMASVPGNESDALADLAAAERTLADRRTTALATVPGELARLLASVAAAGAAHAYLLTESAG
ncbi:hypothetical protein ACGFNV_41750 [Streptomyces sp. NPDC048751]|uniref:hypothetical protein n=1 Tax=Streptomyces sp. NPDC048751 TaxID=3365591 RepID=UPI00371666FF